MVQQQQKLILMRWRIWEKKKNLNEETIITLVKWKYKSITLPNKNIF